MAQPPTNIIAAALSRLRQLLPGSGGNGEPSGQQRPVGGTTYSVFGSGEESPVDRNHDLEIPVNGNLVRGSERLRNLYEMRTYCPEINTAIAIQRDDVFSSESGDDQGVMVSDFTDERELVPVDPVIKTLIEEFLYAQHGTQLAKQIVAEALSFGDSFVEIVFDRRVTRIERLLRLPVGEMFRIETRAGQLLRFEQRRWLHETTPPIVYHPLQIIHWRYRPVYLYGESLFEASVADWEDLKIAEKDLAKGCRDIGVIPVHHEMPEGTDKAYLADYKRNHIAAKGEYLVTDLYTMPGVKIGKISTTYPNLVELTNRVRMRRKRIAMACRTPDYLLGLGEGSAQQIMMQPATAYARHIASVRQCYSEGLNQLIDLHLALNGYPPDQRRYRLLYPQLVVNPFTQPTVTNE